MKITSKSHYGVQVMTDLAESWGQGPISLAQIAHREHLSHDYLEQLMVPLRRHNLVKAQRGVQGGYLLARAPEEIKFGEIIEALEGEIAPVVCVAKGGKVYCSSEKFCKSKKVWGKIQKSFLEALNSVNLREALED